ncbi:MAG TPA: ABC transporter permease [Deltaproteobacteria bacterium]|nr:ABC transporter permease [Deltaproteobacteria bacterium]
MKAVDRKLLRDLWKMKGQALAIAVVMAGGVAMFVMSLSTLDSLYLTRETYYRDYRFADVFASLGRAPDTLKGRIEEIEGVERVETRIVSAVNVDVEGFDEPVIGRVVSLPTDGPGGGGPELNALFFKAGRYVDPLRGDEVVISETFAQAHGLGPGDTVTAVMNGRKKRLKVVGVALSPEYIYQIAPGAMLPDFKRYAIMWMARRSVAAAFDMEGAFNDVVIRLSRGADEEYVLDRLDEILDRYGGRGAYGRSEQLSHRFLDEEFKQLATVATMFPVIFLGVAAFLLNVVVTRLVGTQREEIAVLKSFGYGNGAVGLHYLKLVVLLTLAGMAGGMLLGVWFGKGLSGIYGGFYHFPYLHYVLAPWIPAASLLVSLAASLLGTFTAVRRAVKLPPAEAMRPEPPAVYRETILERMGFKRLLAQPTRMIARHLERRPVKSMLSVVGISFACAIMVFSGFQEDAVDFMVRVEFGLSQREDLAVNFVEPISRTALHELSAMEGVTAAEPFRRVPVKLRFGHRDYRTSIQGFEPGGDLHRVLDRRLDPIELPPSGLVLTDYLGDILGLRPGDVVTVEVLEGSRAVRRVPVAALVTQYMGLGGYMDLRALNRVSGDGDVVSGVYLAVDSAREGSVYARLKDIPRVAGTVVHKTALESFNETMNRMILFFTFIASLLGGAIAFGVVYNSARITLSERSRELATLRVLGFTRGEISYILLGELAALTIAALPLGFVIGKGLCAHMAASLQTELYRVPLVLERDTFATAAVVVMVSAVFSGLIVRRRLDGLDLVAVLKTKE